MSLFSMLFNTILLVGLPMMLITNANAQERKFLFDTGHGQNPKIAHAYQALLPKDFNIALQTDSLRISSEKLKSIHALVLFSPTRSFSASEKEDILSYLKSGGSLLLIFDEEKRMSLENVGVNDLLIPFGMKLTGDIPVPHNCGAIAEQSVVCAARRELPFSGGRAVTGGTVISRVYDDQEYVHAAWATLPGGGKLIVMSDGMAGLQLGSADGIRFHGTGPGDSKYWGKDSAVFMEEIFSFLIRP